MLDAAARHATVRMVREWWHTPTDYEAQVEYFAKRSLTGLIQFLVGLGVGMVGLIVMIAQWSGDEPAGAVVRAVSIVFITAMYVWSWVWWLRPWPSYRVSHAFLINVDIGVTVVTLLNQKVLSGMFGLSALLLVSFYIIFFDGPKALAVHSCWAVSSIAAMSVEIAIIGGGDPVLAFVKLLSGGALAVAPIAAHFGIWALRNEANEASNDPLTGLLNRRGLNLHIDDLLRGHRKRAADVVVIVIDLDRFKIVNDRFGHSVGDEVLVRCAWRLESSVHGGALVARVGGEEFVVVDVLQPGDWVAVADRIRVALCGRDDHAPITASIGITAAAITHFAESGCDHAELLGDLVARADEAMFVAKRGGGNAVSYLPPMPDAVRTSR
ncbi:GGDEF domain-containing protein [Mycobacterium sp. SM3041]|uniref:GGDEF domain-containing protein n=1 Tax=Mycobacterium sp. SM3041 TaxID=3114291 RepID=UPI003204EE75